MKLYIGENLRKLRRNSDLTQEELASHLGISYQAISKWERGDGYPDITLLPSIASYFHISVDELIGMNSISSKQELENFNSQWHDNRTNGRHYENVLLMREALKAFPNDPLLLVQLSSSLERLDGSNDQHQKYLQESVEIQERILNYCDDSEIRCATLSNISDTYYRLGNTEKAAEFANKLPNLYKTRETALVKISDNADKRSYYARSAIEPLIWLTDFHLSAIAKAEKDDRYNVLAEKIIALLREV